MPVGFASFKDCVFSLTQGNAALQVGPFRAERVPVMLVDLPQYSEFARSADGIIGLDLLSRSKKFAIDYPERRLYFELDSDKTACPVPGCFVVPIVIQGLVVRFGVDTGVQDVLLYGDRLKKRRGKLRSEGEPEAVMIKRIRARGSACPMFKLTVPEKPSGPCLLTDRKNESCQAWTVS